MKSKLPTVEIIALTVSAIVTVWTMLRAAAWQIDLAALAIIGWAISPYAVLFVAGVLLRKYTSLPRVSLVSCVTAILMLAFTLLIYLGTPSDDSSTYALIFIFVPAWLYIGGFIVFIVGLLAAWLMSRFGTSVSAAK